MEDFPMENKEREQKVSGIFKCFQCEFKCGTTEDLKEHYQIHRSECPFKCFQCGFEGKDAEEFKKHSMTHFEKNYFKCPKCDYIARHKQNIATHVRYTHKHICTCGIQFKSQQGLSEHLDEHPGCKENVELNENVQQLDEMAKNNMSIQIDSPATVLESPQEQADGKSNQVFVCQVCFYIFRSSEELNDHTLFVHTRHSTFTSNEDSEGNSDTEGTIEEPPAAPANQEAKFFLCGECHFIFSTRASLDEHLQTHQGRDSGNVAMDVYSPVVEMEEGEREPIDYVCYICDKAFGSEKAVKLHMGHHAAIKFRCPKCGLSMKSQSSLKLHMATHPQSKADKKGDFPSKKNAAENAYKCASCPYQTKFHDHLQLHLTTHSKRDPSKRKIKPTFKVRFGRV